MADVKAAIVRAALRTTVGTQDFTVSGFGTPKAAIFIMNGAIADATANNNLQGSIGVSDGTNHWVVAPEVDHGTANVDSRRRLTTDEVLMILNTDGTVFMEANFDSFITDGVRINVAVPGAAKFLTVILLGGDDLSVSAGTASFAAEDAATTVSPGFETNALLLAHGTSLPGEETTFNDTTDGTAAVYGVGFGSYDGATIRQACHLYFEFQSAPAGEPNAILAEKIAHANSTLFFAELGNITATAFDITSKGTDWSAAEFGYLAMNLGGGQAWAGVVDGPTGTGAHSFEEPGFTPILAMLIPTPIPAIDVKEEDADAGAFGFAVATADDQVCNAWASESGSATTDTQTLSDDQLMNLPLDDGSAGYVGTLTGFTASGMDANFTAVPQAAVWPMLFLTGEEVAAGGIGCPIRRRRRSGMPRGRGRR